ncbi:SMP-30/gluconolactonase/LRE family protein [Pelagibacterium lacus]|uniref:SMP-30/gluconolactonase/LRE family protein n=1 Tax=Pelagibacterium lacus TaxID=2282655 RepID=A0A369VZS0_9HYPH|nr:SMP-30/gluconolactonase/LRE family protein [Pelagibacterium lacus]RDE07808.1 SMP-30/gluconolactonase/LRE family protein [Pelagibacterium lacus]
MRISEQPGVVLDCRINLGESCLWDERTQTLRWINIFAGEIWSWSPFASEEPRITKLEERIGAIALREGGGLALALESGFALLDEGQHRPHRLVEIETDLDCTRLNDGRVDRQGRFVSGGVHEAIPQRPVSAVYALEPSGEARTLIESVHCANSICWSPAGDIMYFTDMPTGKIEAFDYDIGSGRVSHRRVFADLEGEPGLADGSIVDAEGCLWNAQWGGGKLVRYSPEGRVLSEVGLPVDNPTCLAFGGPDLDILFITTAWYGLDAQQRSRQPQAGSLFAFRPGVWGLKESRYAG